ncbi:MAG: phosphoribosylglycinamide formyltransferase [Spirochaetales bacterium]|nr:MAG: phosphoribosylglycinamide formyltransferase [Spirochaetales bacterium]
MAECAVLASGSGSNFEAIVRGLEGTGHRVSCLVSDNDQAYAVVRAQSLGVPWHVVKYASAGGRDEARRNAEERVLAVLSQYDIRLVVLAGFMRLLTPLFVDAYPRRILNIHPALLPRYPGIHGIEESYRSADTELGITIHLVDHGMDTGPVLLQQSFERKGTETLKEIEDRIHALEHQYYPSVIIDQLDSCGEAK